MIVSLALLTGAFAADEPAPIVAPPSQWVVSDRIAAVRFDCRLSDDSGNVIALHLIKSGRQLVLNAHSKRDASIDDPVIQDPTYEITGESGERFSNALHHIPGGRSEKPSFGDRGDIVFLNESDDPVALLRFPKPYASSKGVPIVAFLPLLSDPRALETLAGVCSRTRLEDKPA